ncbi:MAG: hypothetical protein VB097_07445 [Rikenellaceae bacterium]|nr:hypothetical protein [Rikenellaceae bacterium]
MRSPVQSWVALQENPTATQWGFLFEGRSSSLESGRKTKKPRRAQPAGFSTLVLFCRPYQDAEPREAILGAGGSHARQSWGGKGYSWAVLPTFTEPKIQIIMENKPFIFGVATSGDNFTD